MKAGDGVGRRHRGRRDCGREGGFVAAQAGGEEQGHERAEANACRVHAGRCNAREGGGSQRNKVGSAVMRTKPQMNMNIYFLTQNGGNLTTDYTDDTDEAKPEPKHPTSNLDL
jgi:hypothetical protein